MSYVPLPTVYEREGRTERAWDIYSRLLRDRIIFIGTPINDFVANAVVAQMLFRCATFTSQVAAVSFNTAD